MAATAAMAAAPHDGYDHAAIPNNANALMTYRGQRCPMGQRPPWAGGRRETRAAEKRGPSWAMVDDSRGPRRKSGRGLKGKSGRGYQRAKGRRECPRAQGPFVSSHG